MAIDFLQSLQPVSYAQYGGGSAYAGRGRRELLYDRLGRLVLSQNAKQLTEGNNYSYTLYDPLSRITEVGQINSQVGAITTSTTKVPASRETWLGNNATNRCQVTGTVYDLPVSAVAPWLTQNPSSSTNGFL